MNCRPSISVQTVIIAMHCNLRPPDGVTVVVSFNCEIRDVSA